MEYSIPIPRGKSGIGMEWNGMEFGIFHRPAAAGRQLKLAGIIQNRNRLLDFGGKKFKIEIVSSILAGSVVVLPSPSPCPMCLSIALDHA
jgi:hypothetical protein